jgi:hypothetical protein
MALTDDLSDGFFKKVRESCTGLKCNPLDALKVWFSESIGIYADAKNAAGAYGINQITKNNLASVGFTGSGDEYIKLTAEEQLPYVEKYYKRYTGMLTSVSRLYQVNYLPATMGTVTQPDGVLAAKDGVYAWAYNSNPSLDPDVPKKGYITLDDLRRVVEAAISNRWRLKTGSGTYADRWKEIVDRLNAAT